MQSEKFWAEYKSLDRAGWIDVTRQWAMEAFPPGQQRAAWEQVQNEIRATLPPDADEAEEEEFLTVREFCDKVGDPPPMIAEGMLSPNTLMLVTGKPKAGKSFLMLQIADDISNGRKMLGKFEVKRSGPVMYFAMEGPAHKWRHRMMQKGMYDRDSPVYVFTRRRDFSTVKEIEWLINAANQIKPVLIIIDTVRQGLNLESTNDADKVNLRMRPLLDAVQQRGERRLPDGCCVILVHHNNKNALAEGGDKISGSNALQSNADGYIIIDDHKRLADGNLQGKAQCESRIDTIPDFIWEMDTETYQIRILEDEDVATVQAEQRIARMERHFPAITNAINQYDGSATLAEISAKSGMAKSMVHRIIGVMLERALVLTDGERPSKRGAPATLYKNCSLSSSIYIEGQLNEQPSVTVQPLSKNGQHPPIDSPVAAFFNAQDKQVEPELNEDWEQ